MYCKINNFVHQVGKEDYYCLECSQVLPARPSGRISRQIWKKTTE